MSLYRNRERLMKSEINELENNSNSIPNKETIKAIEEGRKMIMDKNTVSYSNMEELIKALEED